MFHNFCQMAWRASEPLKNIKMKCFKIILAIQNYNVLWKSCELWPTI